MNAAFYIRMSTDMQENSVESQNQVLISYARTNKINVVEKYIDHGISGRKAEKRPAFMQMIEDSAKGEFDSVLVYDSSRFARNLEESIIYKSTLKRNGVKLISITEPSLDDDSALLTDAMLGALNEMYSRKLSKAVKRGMVFCAQKGEHQSRPPYGYSKKEGKLVINIEEAEIVRKIYDMYLEPLSLRSISIKLNKLGISRRSGLWTANEIKRILLNPVYIGNVYYSGEVYKGIHEGIIEIDKWDKVQKIANERPKAKSRSEATYKHWLSGIMICGYCGGKMTYWRNPGKRNPSFRCNKNTSGACSHINSMSIPKLETLFKDALYEILDTGKIYTYKYIVPKSDNSFLSDALKKKLDKIHLRLERHKAAYSNGIDSIDEYKENKEQCLQEKKEVLEHLETLSNEIVMEEKVSIFKMCTIEMVELIFSDEYSIEQKSLALKSIIQKIVFKNTGEFTIYYFF